MAHVIDTRSHAIVGNVLVDARPRAVAWQSDGTRFWVSSEIGGTVSVVDANRHQVVGKVAFSVPGIAAEAIQPVGLTFTRDARGCWWRRARNRVAVVDARTFEVERYLLVGQRVWNIALSPDGTRAYTTNGVSNDVSVIDRARCGWCAPCRWAACRGASSPCRSSRDRGPGRERPVAQLRERPARRTSPSRCGRRLRGAARPQRVGQDHALRAADALVRPSRRPGARLRAGTARRSRRRAGADRRGVQQPTLDPDLSVRQNLLYHGALHGLPRAEGAGARRRAAPPRPGRADRRARALAFRRAAPPHRTGPGAAHPPLAVAAGRTHGGARPRLARHHLAHVRGLCREGGLAALWSTHLLDEAQDADALVVLHRGRVRAAGSPSAVSAPPEPAPGCAPPTTR